MTFIPKPHAVDADPCHYAHGHSDLAASWSCSPTGGGCLITATPRPRPACVPRRASPGCGGEQARQDAGLGKAIFSTSTRQGAARLDSGHTRCSHAGRTHRTQPARWSSPGPVRVAPGQPVSQLLPLKASLAVEHRLDVAENVPGGRDGRCDLRSGTRSWRSGQPGQVRQD